MTIDARDAVWHHAVNTRDPKFDGVFFVAITSTRIYCRPVCPSRMARPENRRFFVTREAAEDSGFRSCKRCRPDLTSGESPLESVPRLARKAVARISGGALNGESVQSLANTLGMSDRHLRRALGRELGTSPFQLAIAKRLRTAVDLLDETQLPITRVAYSSGFQSLRRFNAAFRQHFQMSPTAWRQRSTRV